MMNSSAKPKNTAVSDFISDTAVSYLPNKLLHVPIRTKVSKFLFVPAIRHRETPAGKVTNKVHF
ncbi:MAG: hypothetical protein Q4C66_14990, partial [Lachnospiraceae bacterium]|nr:hypothetical protein [Lachnospiraceae bacterium]